jgi:hypothetical protein
VAIFWVGIAKNRLFHELGIARNQGLRIQGRTRIICIYDSSLIEAGELDPAKLGEVGVNKIG